ncbi:MAG: Arm DNA-binding domain-containing protein, partial [Bacteroidia bacterium]
MIRITANRKSRYMTTGYSVKTENWDEENNRFLETKSKLLPDKKPLSNAKAINADIEHQLSDVIRVKQQVSLSEGVQTSKRIKEKANSKYTESANFLEYAKELAKKIMTQERVRSSNNYSSVIR